MKITGNQVRADDGGWLNTSHRRRFWCLFVAAAVCGRVLPWRRTIREDNIPRRLFWNKGIELEHALHFIVLGMFTGSLRAQNWQLRCVAIDGHTRNIPQHICAKLHLMLTVVLISRPIGLWKKNVDEQAQLPSYNLITSLYWVAYKFPHFKFLVCFVVDENIQNIFSPTWKAPRDFSKSVSMGLILDTSWPTPIQELPKGLGCTRFKHMFRFCAEQKPFKFSVVAWTLFSSAEL